jgi:hypothetical protein
MFRNQDFKAPLFQGAAFCCTLKSRTSIILELTVKKEYEGVLDPSGVICVSNFANIRNLFRQIMVMIRRYDTFLLKHVSQHSHLT